MLTKDWRNTGGEDVEKGKEPIAISRESKIPILLLELDDFAPLEAKGPIRSTLLVGKKLFLAHAVEPAITRFVELTLLVKCLKNFSDTGLVQGTCCGRPGVIAEIKLLPERQEFLRGLIDKFLDADVFSLRRLLNLLTMLIHTGEKERWISLQPMVARDDIGKDLLISVTEVRRGIRVIDRCGNEKRLHVSVESFLIFPPHDRILAFAPAASASGTWPFFT